MANSWWEIQILCDPALEDQIFWRLDKFGCRGMSTQVKGHSLLLTAHLPQIQAQLLDLAALSLWLRQDALAVGMPLPIAKWKLIDEEDWSSSWKQHWEPQEIGDRILIYPAWLPVPKHSERLLLRLDPLAVRAARSNRELNQISAQRMVVAKGSAEQIPKLTGGKPVDGILCNILAEVIIDLIPALTECTSLSSWGILSGILLDQAKPIADTLEQYNWVVAALWKRHDWCCFNIRRS